MVAKVKGLLEGHSGRDLGRFMSMGKLFALLLGICVYINQTCIVYIIYIYIYIIRIIVFAH